MNIIREGSVGKVKLFLQGRLDTTTAPELEKELGNVTGGEIELDFSELEYVSSAGLRVLLNLQKKMNAAFGALIISHVNESVMEVLDITGFSSILTIK